MKTNVDFKEFIQTFEDEETCLAFLSELKWKNGFECRKCCFKKYSTTNIPFVRKSKLCKYEESATAHILFNNLKFSIQKALYHAYACLYLCLLFFISIGLFSQTNPLKFQHYTVDDGLPHAIVGCIYQDKLGIIWIGTANGLVKFDGYKFTVFQSSINDSNSLSNNLVHKIVGDTLGNLWLATYKGLNKFDPATGIFSHYFRNSPNGNSILAAEIAFLTVDDIQRIWIYRNSPKRLQILDMQNDKIWSLNDLLIKKTNLDESAINMLSKDQKGNIWLSTKIYENNQFRLNYYKYLVKDKTIVEYPNVNKTTVSQRDKTQPNPAYGDTLDSNMVWFASDDGLIKLNQKTNASTVYTNSNYKSLKQIRTGFIDVFTENPAKIWVGTSNNGVVIFNSLTEKFEIHFEHSSIENQSLSNNSIQSFFKDKTNNLWIATLGGGLNKVSLEKKQFISYHLKGEKATASANKEIWSVFEDENGKVWVGTSDNTVNILNRKTSEIERIIDFPGPKSNTGRGIIGSICQDNNGNIWAISWDGYLNKISKKDGKVKIFKGANNDLIGWSFRAILPYKDDYLLITSLDIGLEIFNLKTEKSERVIDKTGIFKNNQVYSIFKTKSNKILLGTSKGLVLFNPETSNLKFIGKNKKGSFDCTALMALYEENDTSLWVGSEGCGLYNFNPKNDKLVNYAIKQGLPSNDVYAIYPDNHQNLWLSTGNGISKFNLSSRRFRNYNANDGIQGNEFKWGSHFQNKSGEVFFGGSQGLTIFQPDSINDNRYTSKTLLTEFRISNKIVKPGDTINGSVILNKNIEYVKAINLSYKDADIYFEFAGLHFTAPEKMQYAYKMEGYDNEWKYTDASKRFAQYTNLDAGDYIFRVKSTNNDGIWCKPEDEVELKISISPPFWKTWWFRSLLGLVLLGSFFGYNQYRIRLIQNRNKILQKMVKLRTIEIEKQKEELRAQTDNLMETNVLMEEKQQELQIQKDEISTKNIVLERQKWEIMSQRDKVYDMAAKVEAVNALKMNFFSNISHEFRTPLTLIIDPLEKMIGDQTLEKKKREDLESINKSAFRLLNLVEQLTDIQKIESENMKLRASLGDIIPYINDIYLAFKPFAQNHSIQFNFIRNIESAELYFDEDKIEKIIYNLLSNAFKFTPENGIIAISVSELNESGISKYHINELNNWLLVEVDDSGTGIAADKIPYIFDRYYHIDSPVEHIQKGTGIGLSLTKDLVELHKSKIFVESNPGKGAKFSVIIPFGKEHLGIDELAEPLTKISPNRISIISSINIEQQPKNDTYEEIEDNLVKDGRPIVLIVDDNHEIRNYLRFNLAEFFQIVTAANGEHGYEKALEYLPDLIISDVMMPEMDGFEFCEKIKDNAQTSFIPFFLLTAKNDEDSKLTGIEVGADDFITKPFSSKTLIAKIKTLFENRKKLKERVSKELLHISVENEVLPANEEFLQKAESILAENLDNSEFGAEMFAHAIGMSYSSLYRKIKELTNLSINVYIRTIRLGKAAILLKQGNKNIAEIAYSVGFKTSNYFTQIFKEHYGVSPSEYALR